MEFLAIELVNILRDQRRILVIGRILFCLTEETLPILKSHHPLGLVFRLAPNVLICFHVIKVIKIQDQRLRLRALVVSLATLVLVYHILDKHRHLDVHIDVLEGLVPLSLA